jgi:hypothetical protein
MLRHCIAGRKFNTGEKAGFARYDLSAKHQLVGEPSMTERLTHQSFASSRKARE